MHAALPLSLSALRERLRMAWRSAPAQWRFCVDRDRPGNAPAWHWEKLEADGHGARSLELFESFADCARDAHRYGFTRRDRYRLDDGSSEPRSLRILAIASAVNPEMPAAPRAKPGKCG
jgi:hypothetical protein